MNRARSYYSVAVRRKRQMGDFSKPVARTTVSIGTLGHYVGTLYPQKGNPDVLQGEEKHTARLLIQDAAKEIHKDPRFRIFWFAANEVELEFNQL